MLFSTNAVLGQAKSTDLAVIGSSRAFHEFRDVAPGHAFMKQVLHCGAASQFRPAIRRRQMGNIIPFGRTSGIETEILLDHFGNAGYSF